MSIAALQIYPRALTPTGLPGDAGPFGCGVTLTDAESQEVASILTLVAHGLAQCSRTMESMRRRLDAIVEALIEIVDELDGDCEDEGAECEDEGAQCDDEGDGGDNGMADADGAAEQGFPHCGGFSARAVA